MFEEEKKKLINAGIKLDRYGLVALSGGVKKAVIIDGRIPHSILIEMLSDEGVGTMFS